MSEDYLAQKPIMEWNTQKKIWQRLTDNTLFELWEPFLETWPTSGMMRNGQVFELPMQALPTTASEFSSLPTPTVADQFTANLNSTQQSEGSLHSVSLAQIVHRTDLLPTPVASEGTKTPSQQTSEVKSKTGQVWLSNAAKDMETNWGKFETAIRRWEVILNRPAPAPTKPDGKDGAHRLSSKFTEWMMGLPDGWITGHNLKRNDELKLAGNGVVPQQAELALRLLLELPEKRKNNE